jgi:DDE superfamily endonuclease
VRNYVLPAMQKRGPVVAWIVDDTGFPKKGKHSVGVTRQYCGQVGKQENCRVAVSLSVATWSSSLPVAYRLYLPKEWTEDAERREKTEVPEGVEFQTKPAIALNQIRAAVAANLDRGVVLADAAYGINTEFRDGLTELELQYVVGVQSSMTIWEPGKQPLPAKPRGRMGRPPRLLQRSTDHQPVSVKQLAMRRRWPGCSGRLLSGGNSILSNFLPTVNGFLVFAIENSFERPHVLVTHDPTEILLSRQHGRSSPTLRHRLVAPSAYSPGSPANSRMRILNQVRAGQAAM